MNKYKMLIIITNDITKKVASKYLDKEDIMLTVKNIKNKEYKNYILKKLLFINTL